jgi:hypothetical protein
VASEREPHQVRINPLEAIDPDAPAVEQLVELESVIEKVNRSLGEVGIKLVMWNAAVQAPGAGEHQDDAPNLDTISADEVAPMMRAVRLEEIRLMVQALKDVTDEVTFGEKHMKAEDVILKLSERFNKRMDEVRAMTRRTGEQDNLPESATYDEEDLCRSCSAHLSEPHDPDCPYAD